MEYWLMIISRHLLAFLVIFLARDVIATPVLKDYTIAYVSLTDDAWYSPQRSYAGMELHLPQRPLNGVRLAIKDARIPGRSVGVRFLLDELSLTASDNLIGSVDGAIKSGVEYFILDLPMDEMQTVVGHFADAAVLFFNVRHPDDLLRRSACGSRLFHTIPSDAMLNDALAQYLKKKRWQRVLVLHGPEKGDARVAKSFIQSAAKFGLQIVDSREFVLSNDPRERNQNNVALLTAGKKHDVVFVADEVGEFSRYIPYQTQEPALVAGSQGLTAAAWHWSFERHGAPQLNQRFEKLTENKMTSTQFAGWAAARSVIAAVVRTRDTDFDAVFSYLISDNATLDLYKGFPGSFRPWSRQLRQPLLLHTHNAVIGIAPIEGFMHQINDLDTLGLDRRESDCS